MSAYGQLEDYISISWLVATFQYILFIQLNHIDYFMQLVMVVDDLLGCQSGDLFHLFYTLHQLSWVGMSRL